MSTYNIQSLAYVIRSVAAGKLTRAGPLGAIVWYKVNRPNLGQTSITTFSNLRGVRQTNTNGFQAMLRGIVFSQPTLLAE